MRFGSRSAITLWSAVLAGMTIAQDASLPVYKPQRSVSGTIRVCGSPQMADLLKRYEEGFAKLQPLVHFDDQLKSTMTAVAGVSSGYADIGLLGREIWPEEEQAFISAKGHVPMVIDVATGSYDVPKATFALMIFVSRRNPLTSISMEQLERIFADNKRPIRTWGELGLSGKWAQRRIHLYGFPTDNDKARIFSKLVFANGERWNGGLKEFGNGADGIDAGQRIVEAIGNDPDGIGISNVHYGSEKVKVLAVASRQGAAVSPNKAIVTDRRG